MNNNYEFVDEIDISEISSKRGRWVDMVENFLKSDKKYCVVSCGSEDEQRKCLASIRNTIGRHGYQVTFGRYKSNSVYLAKP